MKEEVLRKAFEILKFYNICALCLGRLFYEKPSNLIRLGFFIKKEFLKSQKTKFQSKSNCYLCNNAFISFKRIVPNLLEKLKSYEFESLYTSLKVPKKLIEREDEIRIKYNIETGESIKPTFNRIFPKYIAKKIGKKFDSQNYHLLISYDIQSSQVEIIPQNLYIYGRYIKNRRGIYQTRSYCYSCYGKGCAECNYTGYDKVPSVESYILPYFSKAFQAQNAVFHAAGREDGDVLTLDTGRPFIVEVVRPLKRKVDLKAIENEINENSKGDVIVKNLIEVKKDAVKKMMVFTKYDEKTYILLLEFEKEIDDSLLSKIEKELTNRVIIQRTPTRVLHRRKDKYRYKMIYEIRSKKLDSNRAEFLIKCQGGLYIKELAHGDNGRTIPNIAQLANSNVKIISLDIVSIAPDLEKRLGIIH